MEKLSRREFLKLTAVSALALNGLAKNAFSQESNSRLDIVVAKSDSPSKATIDAIEALGGIGKFVKSGDVVIIKPNIAFPNPPEWGSTTNPEVVIAIVKLCLDANARSILIIDHPMAKPEQCLTRTGINDAVNKIASDKVKVSMEMEQRSYTEVKLEKAKALEKTDVHKSILKADVFINIPVAKSHSATTVSFGMKNLMGLIWDRGYLHQKIDLHQGIADLSTFIKPSLIIMDASKALITRGPEGPGRTEKLNTIISGIDPVAVDAYTVTLSSWNGRKYKPEDIRHISSAYEMKLGEMNIDKLAIKQI
ncbi:MAG: DUF362 domain-containing protein [bacterium]